MISGALSGIGGMCFAYSISAKFSESIYVGYGYLAIAALIFGNWKILLLWVPACSLDLPAPPAISWFRSWKSQAVTPIW